MRDAISRFLTIDALAVAAALYLVLAPDASEGADGRDKETPGVKIRLLTEDTVLTATLVDNAATRDFVSLLPLDLTLRDHASTEKVSDLPSRLATRGTPDGVDPEIGDIAYYAPWGNLAIYYRDFGYSKGLVKLGRIDSGIEKLARRGGKFIVRFEVADKGAR